MQHPIIVMGANGGIGEKLTYTLAARGEKVIATTRSPRDFQHDNIDAVICDVMTENGLDALLNRCNDHDGLYGFAYCIGSITLKPLKAAKEDDFLTALQLNMLAAMRVIKALEQKLKQGKASIVLFSTIAVDQGFPNHTVVSTAKGALEGFARALAAEWAPDVRVNCIAPSLTDTDLAKPLTQSPQMREAIEKMHPIPRLGKPDDAAHLAAFLLSADSSWITGQVLRVDGGRSHIRSKG